MPEEVTKEHTSEKDGQKVKAQRKSRTFLNKIVIRKLPPSLTSVDQLIEIISPIPDYTDLYFVQADWSLGAESTSRAYIEFKNHEDIYIFKEKFDDYVFIDSVKGTEYPAIVEYAPFQGLPKSRARKKDKHVGTIETEQHFLNFLDMLKKAEESETQKTEPKLEFSYQIKDDKKITSTPLLEFIAASKEEKREAKKKKIEEKKKQREEEKQKKKILTAKSIPEPIKESKEEVVYDDGIMVRTVPSRLGRNDKNAKKNDSKSDNKSNNEKEAAEKEKREKREKEREEKRRIQREKEKERKLEREQQRAKEREGQKVAKASTEKKSESSHSAVADETSKSSQQPARETKRYSILRKARQEKNDSKELDQVDENSKSLDKDENPKEIQEKSNEATKPIDDDHKTRDKDDARFKKIQELREKRAKQKEERKAEREKGGKTMKSETKKSEAEKSEKNNIKDEDKTQDTEVKEEDPRWKKIKELREKRERERDERAHRQIRNKDRPSMQIYRPKRGSETKSDGNPKSSDENSESNRRRESKESDEKKLLRRDSREERNRRKKSTRKSSNEDEVFEGERQIECDEATKSSDYQNNEEAVTNKLEKLSIASEYKENSENLEKDE